MAVHGEYIRIGAYDIRITHPDKVLFPQDGLTKRDLIDYYRRIAPRILSHLHSRPLALERYPDGIQSPGFFQKATPLYFPNWIETVTIKRKTGGTVRQVVCNNAATLVYLANQACITPHVWLSRVDQLERPDQLVFDLDPSADSFEPVKSTALALKVLLDELGLPAYVKTTGARGLHVAVPLKRRETFPSVRAFAVGLAQIVVRQAPEQRTIEQRKERRCGRVFIDTNRNAYAQTVAPLYSVRPRRGAPISAPLGWDELGRTDFRSDSVTMRNVFERLDKSGDPWRDFWQRGTSLKQAQLILERLHGAG